MSHSRIRSTVSDLIAKQSVNDADVDYLKDLIGGGPLTPVEAGDLIRLERHGGQTGRGWAAFFVETMAGYFLRSRAPHGHLIEADIEWLAFRLGLDSTGPTPLSRALLKVLREEASVKPPSLERRIAALERPPPDWQKIADAFADLRPPFVLGSVASEIVHLASARASRVIAQRAGRQA